MSQGREQCFPDERSVAETMWRTRPLTLGPEPLALEALRPVPAVVLGHHCLALALRCFRINPAERRGAEQSPVQAHGPPDSPGLQLFPPPRGQCAVRAGAGRAAWKSSVRAAEGDWAFARLPGSLGTRAALFPCLQENSVQRLLGSRAASGTGVFPARWREERTLNTQAALRRRGLGHSRTFYHGGQSAAAHGALGCRALQMRTV